MYFLYNLGLSLATILLLPWGVYRALRGRLPGIGERMGLLRWQGFAPGEPVVWLHAVSVGEVKAAATLAKELRDRMAGVRIVITSSTGAGWNTARQLLPPEDAVLYPPADFAFVCRRFLHRINPVAVIVLETELWPNFFRECKRAGAVLVIANGRISDKTFPRYAATRFFWRRVLGWPDTFFVQSSADAQRFQALGAPAEKIRAAGNLKFTSPPSLSPVVASLREAVQKSGSGPVIVAGSTMPGEEMFLLETFQRLGREFPRLWMILAPRHPERANALKTEAEALGIRVQLRSQLTPDAVLSSPGVLILDRIGELAALYQLAHVAYVGGTLVPTGGHNILEPAYFGRPIVIGPSMTNFQEIAHEFLLDAGIEPLPFDGTRTGTVIQISDPASLTPVLRFLLHHPAICGRLGEAARARWESKSNPAAPIADELAQLLRQGSSSVQALPKRNPREVIGTGRAQ